MFAGVTCDSEGGVFEMSNLVWSRCLIIVGASVFVGAIYDLQGLSAALAAGGLIMMLFGWLEPLR